MIKNRLDGTENKITYNKKKEGIAMNMNKKVTASKEKPQGSYCPKTSGCCWNFFGRKKKDKQE